VILGLAALLAVAGIPLSSSEVRSFLLFALAPEYARDAHFLRLQGNEQEVYLLGTIHQAHQRSDVYSLWHIEALIDHLKPDLLLVESRPEELARDNWADGPIEMPFASLTARSLGIRVDGIDWWQKAGSRPGTSSPEREQRIVDNVLERLPGHRTVLILVGYSHVAELRQRLEGAGYAAGRFERSEKQALFSTNDRQRTFPPGMTRYLQQYVTAARKDMEEETDPAWRAATEAHLARRQELLELVEKIGERPASPGSR
jgi:hypothetical protein